MADAKKCVPIAALMPRICTDSRHFIKQTGSLVKHYHLLNVKEIEERGD
jgi:hypothetical protein